ncbi:MAG: ATP-binding protein [Candidatus Cohnella colombiensis]|uniref:ATP-binding protein n=1 Tax=Candidatus Cohnella colombiensis TaxID=3121368 RepID=A0AA95JCW6_9BACL|nr:MAG: ATP-binding protein [Cohnella sp.]
MKIKQIVIENNPIVDNLTLDFCDEGGKVFDTIVIAGENGTGKSTILNMIYELSNFSPPAVPSKEKRIFTIEIESKDTELLKTQLPHFFSDGINNNEVTLSFDFSLHGNWDYMRVYFVDNQGVSHEFAGNYIAGQEYRNIFKSIFSDVEINFNPPVIQSVTSKDLDQKLQTSTRSSGDLASEIAQLLVDVEALDDSDLSAWVRNNKGHAAPEDMIDIRMKRFKDAFHFMFPYKRYKGTKNIENRKKILFEERGKEISIEQLSSGEKQIVFRGGFLLRDIKSSTGALILIDEPEISLHPTWQINILNFFKRLFTDEAGKQTSQLIVVTHSPFIIHNETRINKKVIVLRRSDEGVVNTPDKQEYFGWTSEKSVRKAFNIDFGNSLEKPVVFVEGETDEKYLQKALEVFGISDLNLEIMWIGRTTENGKTEFSGDTALNQTKSFFLANPKIPRQKTILLYDSDTNQKNEDYDNLFVRAMPVNPENDYFRKGIENLLFLPEDFPRDSFYREKKRIDDYSAISIIRELEKTKLCDWICSLEVDEVRKYFAPLTLVLKVIEDVLKVEHM